MIAINGLKIGKTPRDVIRGVNSQTHNEVGIHWLRISIPRQYLAKMKAYCGFYFGEAVQDGYGLWSYDTRYSWANGASLNYDCDTTRSDAVHQGKITLDVPGKALDGIAELDLHLFLLSLRQFRPSCTRIDVFFDDYNRTNTPTGIHEIIKNRDYSGFRKGQLKQRFDNGKMIHDEVDFGTRGDNGSGKYLRVYDKALESDGEKDCIRWEVEFSKERAHKVFDKLSECGSVDAFATLCGSLVAGSIKFVHRNGDKNIGRLEVYAWWREIQELLGTVVIRVSIKKADIGGMYSWVYRQVSPTLACLRDTFVDEVDFMNWLFDVLDEGELNMSQRQRNLAKAEKRNLRYDDGKVFDSDGVLVA